MKQQETIKRVPVQTLIDFSVKFLTKKHLPISPQRAIELTQTMYELRFELPDDPEVQHVLLKMDAEQQMLYDLLC